MAATVAAVTVHVAGAVRRPGVYRLPPARGSTTRSGARAAPAAGGPQRGQPRREARGRPAGRRAAARAGARRRAGAGAAAAPRGAGRPVNLNTATAEQLDSSTASARRRPRRSSSTASEHGGFGSVEELGQVPGIGEKRLAALREQVRV